MTAYDAIVFDNDGVLVERTDTELLVSAIRETFREFDRDPPSDLVRSLAVEDAIRADRLREEFDLDPAAFWRRREANAATAQRGVIRSGEKPLYDDVAALEDLGCPLAVVSNNQQATVEFIVEHFGLDERFEVVYGREPTVAGHRRRKPDPSYIEQALADLGTTDALYVGDSETDVVAADRAGLDSAFLRRPHRADLDLEAEPTYEFPDLTALVERIAPRVRA
ncbi:MAG: HAD family hydrolase [Haloarculaceae archaeon]